MKTLLKSTQPALGITSDLIELVDRVMKRHPHKGRSRTRHKLFSFLMRDCLLVRPSLDRPSQKIDPLVQSQLETWISEPAFFGFVLPPTVVGLRSVVYRTL